MCTDETNETSADLSSEPEETTSTPAAGGPGGLSVSRRTLLKAAALGTAAAALANKTPGGRIHFGPLAAYANDLSSFPCTAQDIDVGEGIVINEPCADAACQGTFCALVKFNVSNSTGTGRYCISLHLPAQGNIPEQDVLLKTGFQAGTDGRCAAHDAEGCPILTGTSTAEGKSGDERERITPMYGVIRGFPCGASRVCFGKEVPEGFTGKCTQAGIAPCATIGFATTVNAAGCTAPDQSPPKGQCRHRQICVRGFGATLECADGNCNATTATTCSVPCGQPLRLKGTAAGGTTDCAGNACPTAPTMKLNGPGVTNQAPDSNGCFTVNNPQAGLYTLTATDCHGCTRTASKNVTVTEVQQPTLSLVSSNPCTGATVFEVSPCPPESGVTYSFTKCDGSALNGSYNATTCRYTVTLPQGQTTCVKVTASNGNPDCEKTDTESVPVPPALSVDAPTRSSNPCSGLAEFTAAASGGTAPYSYGFSGAAGTASGNKFTVKPQLLASGGLDTSCKTLTVTVTDANGCQASNSTTFSQCIDTSTGCTP